MEKSQSHNLRTPWRVDDVERWYAKVRVFYVLDRIGILAAVFPDQQTANAVTELINKTYGADAIPRETGGGN
jgi:hypothetical protein